MKKLTKFLAFMTVIATLFSFSACSGGDIKNYHEAGLRFSLPKDMKEMSVNYADVCYSNSDGVEFFVYFYSRDQIFSDLKLDRDCTTEEYMNFFILFNEYSNVEKVHDSEKDTTVAEYVYEPENTYYCDYVLRTEELLVHVTMCCDGELREIYEPIFEEWMSKIYIDL